MGMVNLMRTLGGSAPKLYRLKKLKIATLHEANYTLVSMFGLTDKWGIFFFQCPDLTKPSYEHADTRLPHLRDPFKALKYPTLTGPDLCQDHLMFAYVFNLSSFLLYVGVDESISFHNQNFLDQTGQPSELSKI